MALVKDAVCSTCSALHTVTCTNFEYGRKGMLYRECRDCIADRADAEILKEKLAAQNLALAGADQDIPTWRHIMVLAQLHVLSEQVFGRSRLPDYWRKVQRYIRDHFSKS